MNQLLAIRPLVELWSYGRQVASNSGLARASIVVIGKVCWPTMKFLSVKQWQRHIRTMRRRKRLEYRRRNGLRGVARLLDPATTKAQELAATLSTVRIGNNYEVSSKLIAPENLHFGVDHNGVAEYAEKIRVLRNGRVPVYLDFTQVRQAGPAAALYVAAEVDRWRVLRVVRTMRAYDLAQWNPVMRTYLRDLGLFELLKVVNPPDDISDPSRQRILRMRARRGLHAEAVTELRDELNELAGGLPKRLEFFGAVSEAMMNVVHHAYEEPDPNGWPRLDGYWWMTADYDPQLAMIRIAILDQGVGIPVRLPRSNLGERLDGLLARLGVNDDAARISAALEYGRTSTGLAGRGKGFRDMQQFVDGDDRNWMRVLSGRGECLYAQHATRAENHDSAIVGTIIEWALIVPNVE
ncbi:MAG: hypothetical protein K2Y40_10095 [Reyranella sp.]|nr:hypothetical protein [Reyranella sp.]